MEELKTFLEASRKDIVDFIQGNQRPIPVAGNAYESLLAKLMEVFPASKDGGKTFARDKAHDELAIAIMEAMWCGWLSQAKANRGAYGKEIPDMFEQAIMDAVMVGRAYAAVMP